jgi:hypothetical protein
MTTPPATIPSAPLTIKLKHREQGTTKIRDKTVKLAEEVGICQPKLTPFYAELVLAKIISVHRHKK